MKNFLLGVMSTVLCIVVLGANYQPKAVKKYEYANPFAYKLRNETEVASEEGDKRVLAFINKQGAKGWRLFQVEYGYRVTGRLWFEREIR